MTWVGAPGPRHRASPPESPAQHDLGDWRPTPPSPRRRGRQHPPRRQMDTAWMAIAFLITAAVAIGGALIITDAFP